MSIKSIKEKQLLVNLAKSFGQNVDPQLLDEVNKHKAFENNIRESIRSNAFSDLNKALLELKQEADRVSIENNYPLPPSLDDLESILEEDIVPEPVKEQTLADLAATSITASVKKDSFQQPDSLLVDADIGVIQRKIKYLEQWLGKISLHGPGGGAGSVARLDHETKLIDIPVYNITSKDYYLGVNYAGNVTIYLPTITYNGRMYIVKDESGNCSINPITVIGNVDNDPGGFILQQDNGGIQMIYREGWRIV